MNDTLWNIFAIIGIVETVSVIIVLPTFVFLMRGHNVRGSLTKDEWQASKREEATMAHARRVLSRP